MNKNTRWYLNFVTIGVTFLSIAMIGVRLEVLETPTDPKLLGAFTAGLIGVGGSILINLVLPPPPDPNEPH